jgi:hypothetical protein
MTTMKRALTSLMTIAALTTLTAGIAATQSLQANIPFTFHAGNETLPAGTYRVSLAGTYDQLVMLRNFDSSRSMVLLPSGQTPAPHSWNRTGHPKLIFECTERCTLTKLWTGSGEPVIKIPHRSLGGDVLPAIAEVRLSRPQ